MATSRRWGGPGRRVNPETMITKQVREVLRLLHVPHWKNFGGPMSAPGVSDLVGALPPAGRALFIELKVPGRGLRAEQADFRRGVVEAGPLAFMACSVREVVAKLAGAGYEPARRMTIQFGGGPAAQASTQSEGGGA